ncbi:HEPN domain-containing protein [Citrobacter portucalensis]|uniref:HEPN domain-containing protein n=1 Tax=Citrobacter portucalensis TaxID=1639133 RepID=UPI003D6D85C4
MAYIKSASRKQFEQIYSSLLEQVRYVSTIKNLRIDIVHSVYNNAIFRASAAFEDYIKEVLEDWIDMLNKNNGCLSHLPDEIILFSLFKNQEKNFIKYVAHGSESMVMDDLNKCKDKLKALSTPNSPVKPVIVPNQLIMDKKYPSKKNIKLLFNRFGIKDIFKVMSEKGKKDYDFMLQSFSDSRTELAHSYSSTNITKDTVIDNLNNVKEIVRILDRILYTHVCAKSGSEYWKTELLMI